MVAIVIELGGVGIRRAGVWREQEGKRKVVEIKSAGSEVDEGGNLDWVHEDDAEIPQEGS